MNEMEKSPPWTFVWFGTKVIWFNHETGESRVVEYSPEELRAMATACGPLLDLCDQVRDELGV
jgi:hypothetical protein